MTKVNIRNGKSLWNDLENKWFFDPVEVSKRSLSDIVECCSRGLQYTLGGFPENYRFNAIKLIREFGGDPRKIIEGKSTEQARKYLMNFRGVGTGISNLFIIYMQDKNLVFALDPRETKLKTMSIRQEFL
ncbi:MAG: hypothetical protein ABIB79_05010 [archaeon]